MYENKHHPLLPRKKYLRRLRTNIFLAVGVSFMGLVTGMVGYHLFEGLSWVDSYANAAMILSGMGPLATLHTEGGKIFAGTYALFSGLTLITIVGLVVAPIIHRFLHSFHMEDE